MVLLFTFLEYFIEVLRLLRFVIFVSIGEIKELKMYRGNMKYLDSLYTILFFWSGLIALRQPKIIENNN